MKSRRVKPLQSVLVCLVLGLAQSTVTFAEVKLVSPNPNVPGLMPSDRFGWSISISGKTVIVGAPLNKADNLPDAGSAYIFTLTQEGGKGTWKLQAHLNPQEAGRRSDKFGYSVSISGDYAVIGAPGVELSTGAVYIYRRDGDGWTQQVKLMPADGAKRDKFGHAVAILGDSVIVAAHNDDSKAGSVYVYARNGNRWTQQAKFTGRDTAKDDNFGSAVALAGGDDSVVDFAIVGAPGHTHNGKQSGAAYIFVHDGGKWTEEAKLVSADATASDFFGNAVSVSGFRGTKRYALIGAPHGPAWILNLAQQCNRLCKQSAAYIFSNDGETWTEEAKLTANKPERGEGFGTGVSIDRNIVLVGVPRHGEGAIEDGELDAGIVYPFLRDDTRWIRKEARATKKPPEFPDQNYGQSVAVSPDFIVIGAYGLHRGNPDRGDPGGGAVYIYETRADWGLRYPVEPALLRPTTLGRIKRTALFQNFPNPFNPETWLPYHLAADAEVTFRIYNIQGQLVRQLDLGAQGADSYQDKESALYWDGRDQVGEAVSSGIYFYHLNAGDFQATKRMVIVK